MKILVVHNEYGKFSGEEAVVYNLCHLLEEQGHTVVKFFRSSEEIPGMYFGRTRAFFSGIYSFSAKKTMRKLLAEHKPDIVHIHNVFPLISPSVLGECRNAGVPIVMTVHNYRLVCPNGLFMVDGRICERCRGGREYWCFLRNCEGRVFKSLGYALRNYVARKRRFFLDNVNMYACLTEFQKQKLIAEGFPSDRIIVVPNLVDRNGCDPSGEQGKYIGYVGRISHEKGIQTLMKSAGNCCEIQFKIAGSYYRMPHLPREAPENFELRGHLSGEELDAFYNQSRIIVLSSICYEGFPTVLIEAMLHGKPVICSRIGGLSEIVEDGVTGLLFEPGNSQELTEKIRYLWDRPDLCRQMGQAGREIALREYSTEKYYKRLTAVYEQAGNERKPVIDFSILKDRSSSRVKRLLFIHNEYAKPSGEEYSAQAISDLLEARGHEVFWFKRSSTEISESISGSIKAFFTGIYNPFAAKALAKTLDEVKPDIIQVQNLYPLISTSIFKKIKERGIPVVMRCPNYRLFCPNGLHLTKGRVCEKCVGPGKEIWCVLNNCLENVFKSTGYALRNASARISRRILDGVDMFIVQTEFQKQKFVERGIPANRIGIVGGLIPAARNQEDDCLGDVVTFAGRVSASKGIYDFLDAAREMPDISFAVAGGYDGIPGIRNCAPSNVDWLGFLNADELSNLYLRSRIIVIPSRWFEGFPNVAVQAMTFARPVVAARLGALTCIVDDNQTGLFFETGNVADLVETIRSLWEQPELCRKIGRKGKEKALREYSPEKYYETLMTIYEKALGYGSKSLKS
ncbi:glycosyltransferase family 4 protein [Planctomycetota bacterium]